MADHFIENKKLLLRFLPRAGRIPTASPCVSPPSSPPSLLASRRRYALQPEARGPTKTTRACRDGPGAANRRRSGLAGHGRPPARQPRLRRGATRRLACKRPTGSHGPGDGQAPKPRGTPGRIFHEMWNSRNPEINTPALLRTAPSAAGTPHFKKSRNQHLKQSRNI